MLPVLETLAITALRKCQAQKVAGNESGLDRESTEQPAASSFHECDNPSYQKTGNWSMVAQQYGRRSVLFCDGSERRRRNLENIHTVSTHNRINNSTSFNLNIKWLTA